MFTAALFITAKTKKQGTHPSVHQWINRWRKYEPHNTHPHAHIYLYKQNRILFSHKNEGNSAIFHNSDKTDFKTKPAMTDNNKGIKPTRGYNICNIYVSNIGAYKYIKWILIGLN